MRNEGCLFLFGGLGAGLCFEGGRMGEGLWRRWSGWRRAVVILGRRWSGWRRAVVIVGENLVWVAPCRSRLGLSCYVMSRLVILCRVL